MPHWAAGSLSWNMGHSLVLGGWVLVEETSRDTVALGSDTEETGGRCRGRCLEEAYSIQGRRNFARKVGTAGEVRVLKVKDPRSSGEGGREEQS